MYNLVKTRLPELYGHVFFFKITSKAVIIIINCHKTMKMLWFLQLQFSASTLYSSLNIWFLSKGHNHAIVFTSGKTLTVTLLPEKQVFHLNSQAQPKLVFSTLQDSNVPKSQKVTLFFPLACFSNVPTIWEPSTSYPNQNKIQNRSQISFCTIIIIIIII